jgi:hypothetical protein
MRKTLTIFAIVGAIGFAATIVIDLNSGGRVAAQVARGVTGGVILGASAWPPVAVDVQSRLVLAKCNEQGECLLASVNFSDD